MNRRVIVLGGVHHNTLGVVRALGQKGLQEFLFVILIGKSENNLISVSKYINKGHCFTTEKFEDLIPLLMELKQENEKSVVITTADPIAYILDKQYDNLSRYFILPNINQQEGKIAEAENKDFQSELARKCGINVPISLSFEKESVFSTIENWDYYPCIIKPIDSINGGKNDIHICNNAAEIINNASSSLCTKLQIQEHIDKDFEFQLIGFSLRSGEIIIIPGFTIIIRQPNNTNTGYLKYSPIDELKCDLSKIKRYIQELGYSGLFSMEFLKGKDGIIYFMEINMRNDGNAFVVTTAGINLPYLWYYFCCNGTLPEKEPLTFEKTVYFMPEFSDFTNVIKGKTNIFTWIKQAYKADCYAVFHAKDRKPFWCELKNYCYRAINKITKELSKMNLKRLYQKTQESIWKIGFIYNSFDEIIEGKPLQFRYVPVQEDRWWADPFILDVTDQEIILLVEEYQYKRKRGTIAKLVLDKETLQVKSDIEILVLDTHLSFPAILRKKDIYVYPENSKGNGLRIYKFDQEKNVLVDGEIVSNEPLTDAIYTELLGGPMIISTKEPNPNGKVLSIYVPQNKDKGVVGNKYQLKEEFVLYEKIARNAGDWFEYNGKLYRPAQECNVEYGHSTYIQEVTKDENGNLQFTNIRTLISYDKDYNRGLHTFNMYQGLIVIDVKGYRYPKLALFLKKIRNVLH